MTSLAVQLPRAVEASTGAVGAALQRKCACGGETHGGGECEACRKKREGRLQRAAIGGGARGAAPRIVHEVLGEPGQPLDRVTAAHMSSRFGHDFSTVRVHDGPRASDSAAAVGAEAYTVGSHLAFARGRYAPRDDAGRALLAHELAHVVQQHRAGGTPTGVPLTIGPADDPAEREADRMAQAAHGGAAVVTPSIHPRALRRQTAPPPTAGAPAPSIQKFGPPATHPLGDVTYGSLGKFSAELNRREAIETKGVRPCILSVTMRIKFQQSDPAAWPAGRFAKWQQEAASIIQSRWSFRYLLVRSGKCPDDEPCARSTVVVRMQPVTSGEHHVVNVRYNKPEATRSDALNWYEPDVRRSRADIRKDHATATHEFGHLLGLEHVAAETKECKAATANDDVCYGRDREERAGVMGAGEIVEPRDYQPFLQPMKTATSCDWKVEGKRGDVFGLSWSAALGTTLGVAGGIGGLLLGLAAGFGPLGIAGLVLGGALLGAGEGWLIGKLIDA